MSFILATGLRYPFEINSLKWKNVLMEERRMYIKRKSRLAEQNKMFPVQIYDEAFDILTRLKARDVSNGPEDYVFIDNKDTRIRNINKPFKKCLRECGIDKEFPMYGFRHQFATEMIANGMPPKALADQLGHKSMRMIDETYTHLTRQHHSIIAERIGLNTGKKPEAKQPKKQHWILTTDFSKPLTDAEFEELTKHMFEGIKNGQK